jgi:hypothetical protein
VPGKQKVKKIDDKTHDVTMDQGRNVLSAGTYEC